MIENGTTIISLTLNSGIVQNKIGKFRKNNIVGPNSEAAYTMHTRCTQIAYTPARPTYINNSKKIYYRNKTVTNLYKNTIT